MGGIFISYRRGDSGLYAGRLRDMLSRDFGAEQVFRDIDTINPGERFPRVTEQAVGSCDALLALIGPTWLAVKDAAGRRRLDNPEDYVRLEIATALGRSDVLVIPVLVGTASMPAAADLPKPLAALAEFHAVRITDDENWNDQVARLTRELEKVVQRLIVPSPLPIAVPKSLVIAGNVPRTQQREHAVETLAKSVHLQWLEEAKIRGLFDPDPMPVRWTLTEHDVSDHSRHITRGPLTIDGTSDRIDELTEQFQRLSRRRLVILGGPGSGKTTLAVQLLLRLLEVRTPADPVPVLLTANSWNTAAHPRLQDWLTFRLGKDYPAERAIDEAIPGELVDSGMVLPVIDGLDELDPGYRSILLTTLNNSLGGTDPLVLTCRTDEYVDAVANADVLTAAAVIEARPLTAPTAADYLDNCLPPRLRPGWDLILDQLCRNDDTALADVCSTPLGLWLLRSDYIENKSDPTPLIDPAHYPDAEAIRAHLFDELIPALISKRRPVPNGSDPLRPRRAWEPDATRRWLAYLAMQLHGERELRWWRLPAFVPPRFMTTLMALLFTVIMGFFFPFGPVFGLLIGRKVCTTPEPGYTNLRLRGRGRRLARELVGLLKGGLKVGLVIGLVIGLICLVVGLLLRLLYGGRYVHKPVGLIVVAGPLVGGLVLGLIGGLLVVPAKWVRSPARDDRSRTPTSTYRGSRNLIIMSAFLSTLMATLIGLVIGLLWGLLAEPEKLLGPLEYGLLLGLLYGLPLGLAVGSLQEPAWLGFVVTARWLAFRGKLPWHIMGFLDDAHRLGLLRTVGSVYQFRHAELQDHLAKSAETAAPALPRGERSPELQV